MELMDEPNGKRIENYGQSDRDGERNDGKYNNDAIVMLECVLLSVIYELKTIPVGELSLDLPSN